MRDKLYCLTSGSLRRRRLKPLERELRLREKSGQHHSGCISSGTSSKNQNRSKSSHGHLDILFHFRQNPRTKKKEYFVNDNVHDIAYN